MEFCRCQTVKLLFRDPAAAGACAGESALQGRGPAIGGEIDGPRAG